MKKITNHEKMTNSLGCLQQRCESDCTAAQSNACLYAASKQCRASIGLPAKRHINIVFADGPIVARLKKLCSQRL